MMPMNQSSREREMIGTVSQLESKVNYLYAVVVKLGFTWVSRFSNFRLFQSFVGDS